MEHVLHQSPTEQLHKFGFQQIVVSLQLRGCSIDLNQFREAPKLVFNFAVEEVLELVVIAVIIIAFNWTMAVIAIVAITDYIVIIVDLVVPGFTLVYCNWVCFDYCIRLLHCYFDCFLFLYYWSFHLVHLYLCFHLCLLLDRCFILPLGFSVGWMLLRFYPFRT